MRDSEFDFIRSLVYERSRINLSPDKRQLVSARLGKRLRAMNVPTIGEYCRLLQEPGSDEELVHLIDAISTNHTFFFRESSHFDFLREIAAPEMLIRARSEHWSRFRVWSSACSSGEEPYSIAITLAECMPDFAWEVEASDISSRVLARAAAGIYSGEVVAKLPRETLRTHFQRGFGPQEGNYRVKRPLRDRVVFHHLNLLEGEFPFREPFQVIFCRNVMIYFDRPTQDELVTRLARWLVPGGYLFVGHSESLTQMRHALVPVKPAIYRKPLGS